MFNYPYVHVPHVFAITEARLKFINDTKSKIFRNTILN